MTRFRVHPNRLRFYRSSSSWDVRGPLCWDPCPSVQSPAQITWQYGCSSGDTGQQARSGKREPCKVAKLIRFGRRENLEVDSQLFRPSLSSNTSGSLASFDAKHPENEEGTAKVTHFLSGLAKNVCTFLFTINMLSS